MSFDAAAHAALFEMSRDAVIGVDGANILFANPAARKLLGAQAGMDAAQVVPAYILEDPAERFVASTVIDGASLNVAVVRQGRTCLMSWAVDTAESLAEPTLPERASQALAETLSSLRLAFDAIVSGSGADSDPRLHDYATVVYRDYYRLQRLCRHMAADWNLRQGTMLYTPATVDLEELFGGLCDTVRLFCDKMDIGLSFSCAQGNYITRGDPSLLEDMLLNLITNSFAHVRQNGLIRVGLERRGKRFILSVNDDGSGFGPEVLKSIFDASPSADLRLREPGAGFGLSIARGIAQLHGGALIVESRPGFGTALRVNLPVSDMDPAQANLCQPVAAYGDGMDKYLTELSVVLDAEIFNRRFFD